MMLRLQRVLRRAWVGVALGLCLALLSQPFAAYACAVSGAQAYQASNAEVARAMERAAISQLGPEYRPIPQLEIGYPNVTKVAAAVPCVLVKAVAYVEASWRQALGSVPIGATGAAKVSGSCGYGIMQITSGMRNAGELPADTQQRIATDYQYNIAWGASLLGDKWNAMDFFDAVVGNRDPSVAENWYYAVWAYNQFNFRNNPNNPDYPWPRPAFDGSQSRLNYPYQELVFGFAANPPRSGGVPMWDALPVELPNRDQVGMTPGPLPAAPRPHSAACRTLYTDPAAISLQGGSSATTTQVTLHNAIGPGALAWKAEVSGGGAWINVTPVTGTTAPTQFAIIVDPRKVSGGVYRAQVTLTGPPGTTSTTLPVELNAGGTVNTNSYLPYLPRRVPLWR